MFKTYLTGMSLVMVLFHGAFADLGICLDFKGGFNLAKFRGDGVDALEITDTVKTKMNPGIALGMGLGLKFNDIFVIQPELYVTQKGIRLEFADRTGAFKLLYVELLLPVLKINANIDPAFPHFFVGPALSFCTKAKALNYRGPELDMKDRYQGVDFGLMMGCGVDIKTSGNRTIFGISYNLGLLDINDPRAENNESMNGVLTIWIGLGIDLN